MQFKKLMASPCIIAILSVTCMLFSCKKDDKPATPPETIDTIVITKAFFYELTTDTSAAPDIIDSFVYKADGMTLDKIISITSTSSSERVFGYNKNNQLTSLKGKFNNIGPVTDMNYQLTYNSSGTLDSIEITSSLYFYRKYLFTYNDSNQLVKTTTYQEPTIGGGGIENSLNTFYFRDSTTGYIDSIHQDQYYPIPAHVLFQTMDIKYKTPVATDKEISLPFTYSLILATRNRLELMYWENPVPMTHQLFNPTEPILRDHTTRLVNIAENTPTQVTPFTVRHTVDADGRLNYLEYPNGKVKLFTAHQTGIIQQ